MSTNNIYAASHQWMTRPDDQRFVSLDELRQSVEQRKSESWTAVTKTNSIDVVQGVDAIQLSVYDPNAGRRIIEPTNYAFGQLAQYAKAPASYLRTIPAPLAAMNLQWGLDNSPIREDALVLGQSNGSNMLRAMTSTSYGRIWDLQVVDAVMKANRNGNWKIPAASYATKHPKRATTLYASDRDVFIFLVDDQHPVEVNGEQLFRGFITWNSEVGAATFGLTTFLYRYVCDNRIVWGATNVQELRIRHTGGAPERFAYEGEKYLTRYANEGTQEIVDTVKAASRYELPGDGATKVDVRWENWLKSRGFTREVARQAVAQANAEEGEARSLWNVVNGLTAYARQIPHTDDRVKLETEAGRLLNYARP